MQNYDCKEWKLLKAYRFLNINGAVIESQNLEQHLEKIASNHIIKPKSDKQTYPITRMLENYEAIKEVSKIAHVCAGGIITSMQ